eukprot:snap_masked-scaffold348_size200312-processed-gene-1.13 protein:Tk10911 transcript:snap_masked-scaffold348_size200312-processed-gene-1.13-mRNA-1 annotation:"isoform b"
MSVDGEGEVKTFYSAYSFPPQTKTYVYPPPMMYPAPMAFVSAPMAPFTPSNPPLGIEYPAFEAGVTMRQKHGGARPGRRRPASFHHLPQPYHMAMFPNPSTAGHVMHHYPYQSVYYPCMSTIPPESVMDHFRSMGSGKTSSSKSSDYAKFEDEDTDKIPDKAEETHMKGTDERCVKKRHLRTKKRRASLLPLDSILRVRDLSSSEDDCDPDSSQKRQSHLVQKIKPPRADENPQHNRKSKASSPLYANGLKNNGNPKSAQGQSVGSSSDDKIFPPNLAQPRANDGAENPEKLLIESDTTSPIHQVHHQPTPRSPKSPSPLPPPQLALSPAAFQKVDSPIFDRLPARDRLKNQEAKQGSLVEVKINDIAFFGVVRWSGWLPDQDKQGVGIELDEEMIGATNGWHHGAQMFACPDRKAVFVPETHFKLDPHFRAPDWASMANTSDSLEHAKIENAENSVVHGVQEPIQMLSGDVARICGRQRGLQGQQNSCYLDATLFVMFSFTSVFDSLLYRPQTTQDIREYCEVQRVLREEIVNPLRKNLFVRADRVMKLRRFLDHLSSVTGLTTEEKDPEEFLNSLLSQTLRAKPFLQLSSGQESHLYQLFVERQERLVLPTVQELLEQSIITSQVKLKRVPSVLILQMPRFGNQFKVYNRVMPSQLLDVTDIIENAPRQCIICGKLATQECQDCYGDQSPGLDSTAFCDSCLSTVHNHQKRKNHQPRTLTVPEEYLANKPIDIMSSSTQVGEGECNGYNIPEVTPATDVPRWLSDEGIETLKAEKDDKCLPTQAKRLICDAYMCFYQSPEVMMYQ